MEASRSSKNTKNKNYRTVSDGKVMKGFFFSLFSGFLTTFSHFYNFFSYFNCSSDVMPYWLAFFVLWPVLKEHSKIWEGNNKKKKYPESKCLARSSRAVCEAKKANSVLVLLAFSFFLLFSHDPLLLLTHTASLSLTIV